MKSRSIRLQYSFQPEGQRGADLHNPLFDLLSALREHGSIQQAARASGSSYRHVWGALKLWQEQLGQPLVSWAQGQPARLTPFAERLLWAEARARARLAPHIDALRAELERVLTDAFDGTQQVLAIYASHDAALPLLRERAGTDHGLHLELKFAGSMDALRALAEGRCGVAGFHVPPLADSRNAFARALKPLLKPGRHKLIGCSRRTQGLMVAAGNPLGLHGLADLAAGRVRFVQRQGGSGTRLLTEHLLHSAGMDATALDAATVGVEDSHGAVAAAVASGLGDAGIGIASAAHEFGLGFVPLIDEDYFLVCLADVLEQPAVVRLRALLQSPAWRDSVAALPGYAPSSSGQVLSLTRALPWWHFRAPRHAPAAAAAAPLPRPPAR
jgi:putative molybdopterin biosynthesis protein